MKILITLIISFLLTACSVFQDSKQNITLSGPVSSVTVNDKITTVPSIVSVDRDKSITINKYKEGKVVFTKTLTPVPSTWGKLDTWGVYFLFPGIGLFSPGALELDETIVHVP